MNMTDMINNMSEETMISLALFTGAAIIYVIRKFGSMNQQLPNMRKMIFLDANHSFVKWNY